MNTIRIILVVLGVIFLGGIWWWERYGRHKSQPDQDILDLDGKIHIDDGTDISDLSDLEGITATGAPAEELPSLNIEAAQPSVPVAPVPEKLPEKILVLSVIAPPDRPFTGLDLLAAIQNAHLVYGEMNIFHHLIKGQRRALFSMANLVEPGTFNPPAMENFTTPGVIFFMRLPSVIKGQPAFDLMLRSAQTLTSELAGSLCDQGRRPLDRAGIIRLRDDLTKY